ncbi:hypothetical protein ACQPZF_31265 [Actinosynnema sp. CS-041913]|uniref:hypothetical protein n=1 Tax=Actinosynnema sp. CS-041913 TaxID=3239917 RepID=UPI003D8D8699
MTRRVAGVVALLLAAPLALVGTFLPLYEQSWEFPDSQRMAVAQTGWQVTSDGGDFGRDALFGLPMVVAALLLVLGAARVGRMWGRLVAAGGAMLLLGGAWAVWQFVLAIYLAEQDRGGLVIITTFGLALPLLGLACALAVGGALAVQDWPPRAPRPAGPVVYQVEGNDDDTPPFGIPLPPDAGAEGKVGP